LNYKRKSKN